MKTIMRIQFVLMLLLAGIIIWGAGKPIAGLKVGEGRSQAVSMASEVQAGMKLEFSSGRGEIKSLGWESSCPEDQICMWENPLLHFEVRLQKREMPRSQYLEVAIQYQDQLNKKKFPLWETYQEVGARFSLPETELSNALFEVRMLDEHGKETAALESPIPGEELISLSDEDQ